jgi:hypothetical protein
LENAIIDDKISCPDADDQCILGRVKVQAGDFGFLRFKVGILAAEQHPEG